MRMGMKNAPVAGLIAKKEVEFNCPKLWLYENV